MSALPSTSLVDKSDVHAKVKARRSRSKSSNKFWLFQTETPVLNSQVATKLCTKIDDLFKDILQISISHRTKELSIFTWIEGFWTVTPVWIHQCIARPPNKPPVILSGTPELGWAPLTCVCWQINSILANIGHRNSIPISNQYPFWWNILIWA